MTDISDPPRSAAPVSEKVRAAVRIDVEDLTTSVKGAGRVLNGVTFSVMPGELVAIVGGSGAGKTTLLEAMAGVRPAQEGRVRFDGVELAGNASAFRSSLGYVPQDDIIHLDLPLERTIRYAAQLRLAPGTSHDDVDRAVAAALTALDLTDRADVRVGDLSGGQRKRASIAVELLTEPRVFFLDEPTSGLDPATGAELLRVLRRRAASGPAVVFTPHAGQDVAACGRVVFLARGGNLAYAGPPAGALSYFEVDAVDQIYVRLASESTPEEWADAFRRATAGTTAAAATT